MGTRALTSERGIANKPLEADPARVGGQLDQGAALALRYFPRGALGVDPGAHAFYEMIGAQVTAAQAPTHLPGLDRLRYVVARHHQVNLVAISPQRTECIGGHAGPLWHQPRDHPATAHDSDRLTPSHIP